MPCSAYSEMQERWDHLDALIGGTREMRRRRTEYLPKEEKEQDAAYNARLGRSILFGAYKEALGGLTSKPFTKPASLKGELPGMLAKMEFSIDRQNRGLTQFARAVFQDMVHRGLTHILVDFPDKAGGNLEADIKMGIRPYFYHVLGKDLIGWVPRRSPSGRFELAQIRIREKTTQPDDNFGEKTVDRVRVLNAPGYIENKDTGEITKTLGTWEVWEKSEEDWERKSYGTHTFPGIPLVTLYTDEEGFMQSFPPLEDLGWLNIAHWQSYSDQRNILRFARTYTPVVFGVSDDEIKDLPPAGVNAIWRFSDSEGHAEMLEHSGASIQAGERDLDKLQEQMELLGLQPLLRRSGTSTATAKSIDEDRANTDMQSWVRNLEAGLELAFEHAATWANVALPEDFGVDIFNEFGLSAKGVENARILLEARKAREITHETFLIELARLNILRTDLDIEAEIDAVQAESDSSMMVTPEPDPAQTEPDPVAASTGA